MSHKLLGVIAGLDLGTSAMRFLPKGMDDISLIVTDGCLLAGFIIFGYLLAVIADGAAVRRDEAISLARRG